MELFGTIRSGNRQNGGATDRSVSLDFVLIAGPPNAGKTTIAMSLANTGTGSHLNSDSDIFQAIFNLWPDPGIRGMAAHLGEMERWLPLRNRLDIDRLFQVLHRDWLICHGMPRVVLADGFIYHLRAWRNLVATALEALPDILVRHHLWLVHPGAEEFHRRFEKNVLRDSGSEGYAFYFHGLKSQEERRLFTSGVYEKFFNEFESPRPGDPWSRNYRELVTDADVESAVKTLNR